jgi:plastocyanin
MNKFFVFSALPVIALVLSACGSSAAPTQPPVATEAPVMTEAPPATEEVPTMTEAPTESPTETPEAAAPAAIEGEAFIDISGSQFSQSLITVKVGASVTWTNKSDNEHTVTSDDGLFDTSLVGGDTFSFTFDQPGEFPYHCEIHRGMKGRIIVVE